MARLLLALGANIDGPLGAPAETLQSALEQLERAGLRPVAISRLYRTAPVGGPRQPDFLNAVIEVEASTAPAALLRELKRIERRAGRRSGPVWGPRPCDIDILDYGWQVRGWDRRKDRAAKRPPTHSPHRRPPLCIPHPLMQARAFVLVPLSDIAPRWRHRLLGGSLHGYLSRLPRGRSGRIRMRPWPALAAGQHS
jgi:2-amino-4-hydroxy-6-hydroxymethyldihydropteridine diphosphokinase